MKSWIRSILPRVAGHATILLYHRVMRLDLDPQWLSVRPKNFAEHLEVLREHYRPLSLSQLVENIRTGEVQSNSVVVTFDDGYSDNLHNAKPFLERFDVPATVFVVADQIVKQNEFWWDELEAFLLLPTTLPGKLSLEVDQRKHSWLLNRQGTEAFVNGSERSWNLTMSSDPSPRHKIYRDLATILRKADETTRESTLDELALWAGVQRQTRDTHRTLSANEVADLDEGELIDIGAHTVSHPVLAMQPREDQIRELQESKRMLEAILSRTVEAFSYPYGGRNDYSAQTVMLTQDAGFTCACSNIPEKVTKTTSLYELPRHIVRDWDGDEFAKQMEKWSGG